MSSQDDKASYFGAKDKRGTKVSYVKDPISKPKKYKAGSPISMCGNTKRSNIYGNSSK